ncbi:MAG: helix-turn-helix domain-containing protein [Alphaproteobacteria bacterium]|nr:helix-turn-helix domain-containing protein [Alphaproteobacteria bacterium]
MTQFRPVRSLVRGLDILQALNRRNGATVTEVAQETSLSRGTVYRMLETLREAGYVFRDSADARYRLTIMVRGLSDGFSDESWVSEIAKPRIEALCKKVVWPIAIATIHGTTMLIRETTDKNSPLALRRISGGFRFPILASSAGQAYLAFCPDEQRETMLDVLSRSNTHPSDMMARNPRLMRKILGEVREKGFATTTRPHLNDSAVAVPVLPHGRVVAAISLRYIDSAMSVSTAVGKYLDELKETARDIAEAFEAKSRVNGD